MLDTWLAVLALTKAIFEAVTAGADLTKTYDKYRKDRETNAEANRLAALGTYSDEEVEAILGRLQSCRDLFVAEGSGANRHKCLCSVFGNIVVGNGGTMPPVDDWERMYKELNCDRSD